MRKFLYFLSLLLLLSACGGQETEKRDRPDNVLPKDDFIRVMVDLHLVEAMSRQGKLLGEEQDPFMDAYYQDVFDHHGITRAQFDTTFTWYRADMKEMKSVYEATMNELTKMRDTL